MAQCVSRAPPDRTLPAFLNLNGIKNSYLFLDEQTGRIYRILLWVMYNRIAEISELKEKIESFDFGNDLSKYKHLIEGFVSTE